MARQNCCCSLANVWWYEGKRVAFRSLNYGKVFRAILSQPALTLADMHEKAGINKSATLKLITQLTDKKYVGRGEKTGSCHDFITPSA